MTSSFTDRLESFSPLSLKPNPRNARTDSKKQVQQIARSLETFGFTNPVLIDENDMILAGHGRVEAAKLIGLETIPCRRIGHLSSEEKRAYVLADNKLALNAGWDEVLLAKELQELLNLDLGFEIEATGFSIPEIDTLVEGLAVEEHGDPADDIVPDKAPRRCKPGDLWQLGGHRLLCASALDPFNVSLLMDGERARMTFTDPPYNVPIAGHVSGLGKVKHREFAMASGEMTRSEFVAFLENSFRNIASFSADGAIAFVCMDWRHMGELLEAGGRPSPNSRTLLSGRRTMAAWAPSIARAMNSFSRSRSEPPHTSIISNSANMAATGRMSGTIAGSIPAAPSGLKNWRSIQRSNPSR